MQPTPYVFFNGNCAEAIAFYGKLFGTEPSLVMTAEHMPDDYPVPDDAKHLIMHATLPIGKGALMASDSIMEPSSPMAGSSVMVSFDTVDEARKIWDGLADGAKISMPFAATFWSTGFGTLTDRFGIQWMVGTDEEPG